jgi:UDP-GlcNAc3NAcA epimerase
MYDAARHFAGRAERSDVLGKLGLARGTYVLATVHRAENTDDETRLRSIFEALETVAAETPVVMPLHPRTREALARLGATKGDTGNLRLLDPVRYLDMLLLERNARLIITDSGGAQKEAFFFRVPCMTLREETEWVELVELGWNRLVPPGDAGSIAGAVEGALMHPPKGREADGLYGGGRAAEILVEILVEGAG